MAIILCNEQAVAPQSCEITDTIMEERMMYNDSQRTLINSIVDRLQADHVDLRLVSLGEMKRLIREAQSSSAATNRQVSSKIAT